MSWTLHRHDARHISGLLDPESVDLIVTSPPYFALRSYRDGGEHYDGQVGSEATPGEFVDTLIACTADWLTVLRPGGSLWVNLGDKYAGSGGHNNASLGQTPLYNKSTLTDGKRKLVAQETDRINATRRNAPDRYNQSSDGIPAKSLMGLPWRYALRCVDELGLILRAEIIWSKPNGLPESVTDRVRRSHEQWFHFTRQGRYFAAIDEVREAHESTHRFSAWEDRKEMGDPMRYGEQHNISGGYYDSTPTLGKVPGSVWSVPSEPLDVPADLGVDHFAAFPSELPRRIILGWSPTGYCTACGEARRAVVDKQRVGVTIRPDIPSGRLRGGPINGGGYELPGAETWEMTQATITGYACACTPYTDHHGQRIPAATRTGNALAVDPGNAPRQTSGSLGDAPRVGPWREYHFDGGWTPAPTRPAVVLDPFCGTGTVPAVAHLLGRHGIGVDLSGDYLRLAEWRCTKDRSLRDKVLDRSGIPNPDPPKIVGQLALFGETS